MRFSLEHFTPALVRSVSHRMESHGKDLVPAVDIGLRLTLSNAVLDQFEKGLTKQQYKKASVKSTAEPELEGVDPIAELTELRTSMWEMPLDMRGELVGRNVVIDYGAGGKSNIELSCCNVNTFKADLKQGGSVDLDFRVQCSGINEKTAGQLVMLIKHQVNITMLSSPEADGTQEQIGGGSPFRHTVANGVVVDNATGQPAEGGKTAEDIFAEQHGEPRIEGEEFHHPENPDGGEPSASQMGLSEHFDSTKETPEKPAAAVKNATRHAAKKTAAKRAKK